MSPERKGLAQGGTAKEEKETGSKRNQRRPQPGKGERQFSEKLKNLMSCFGGNKKKEKGGRSHEKPTPGSKRLVQPKKVTGGGKSFFGPRTMHKAKQRRH